MPSGRFSFFLASASVHSGWFRRFLDLQAQGAKPTARTPSRTPTPSPRTGSISPPSDSRIVFGSCSYGHFHYGDPCAFAGVERSRSIGYAVWVLLPGIVVGRGVVGARPRKRLFSVCRSMAILLMLRFLFCPGAGPGGGGAGGHPGTTPTCMIHGTGASPAAPSDPL